MRKLGVRSEVQRNELMVDADTCRHQPLLIGVMVAETTKGLDGSKSV